MQQQRVRGWVGDAGVREGVAGGLGQAAVGTPLHGVMWLICRAFTHICSALPLLLLVVYQMPCCCCCFLCHCCSHPPTHPPPTPQEPQYPSGLSYDAVSFMMQALEKNPQKRPSVRQLLAHPWFDSIILKEQLQQQQQLLQ